MANLNFYALKEDMLNILDFIFKNTNCRIFEARSGFNMELKEFRSLSEMDSELKIGITESGHEFAIKLQLWSPEVVKQINIEKFDLKHPVHSFQHSLRTIGLMQLNFGGKDLHAITPSQFGCSNEKDRRQLSGKVEHVDWDRLLEISSQIKRHILKQAVAKVRACPILSGAYKGLEREMVLRFPTTILGAQSSEIKTLK